MVERPDKADGGIPEHFGQVSLPFYSERTCQGTSPRWSKRELSRPDDTSCAGDLPLFHDRLINPGTVSGRATDPNEFGLSNFLTILGAAGVRGGPKANIGIVKL